MAPPTGREMYLITQSNHEDTKRKADLLLQKHLEIAQQERRLYGQTGIFIKQPVHTRKAPEKVVTIQQALCSIRAKNGK